MADVHVAVDGAALAHPHSGNATYSSEMIMALAAARPRARLTVYAPPGSERPRAGPGVAFRVLPSTRLVGRHLSWPGRLRRLRPDVYWSPIGQLPLGGTGCPSVVTVHDVAIYVRPEWFPSGQGLSTRLVVPRSIARADAIVASSKHTAADVVRFFDVPAERIEVVPLGVSRRFRPLPVEGLVEVRRRLGLPDRFVLFVGTIEPRKNLPTLLDAWAAWPDRVPLVVAGRFGWRFGPIREHMQRLGEDVIHLADVSDSDLPALYNLAAILAHPAHYEGFGLTPLEAMACGTPVICSTAASLPEVVGDAALMVGPDGSEAWAAALGRLNHDPDLASSLRRRGILRAAEFSWEAAALRMWRVLAKVGGGRLQPPTRRSGPR